MFMNTRMGKKSKKQKLRTFLLGRYYGVCLVSYHFEILEVNCIVSFLLNKFIQI